MLICRVLSIRDRMSLLERTCGTCVPLQEESMAFVPVWNVCTPPRRRLSGEPASPGGVFLFTAIYWLALQPVDPSLSFNSADQLWKILARVMQSSDALVLHVNCNNLTFSFCSQQVTSVNLKMCPWIPASRSQNLYRVSLGRLWGQETTNRKISWVWAYGVTKRKEIDKSAFKKYLKTNLFLLVLSRF